MTYCVKVTYRDGRSRFATEAADSERGLDRSRYAWGLAAQIASRAIGNATHCETLHDVMSVEIVRCP